MEFKGLRINIIILVIGIVLLSFFTGQHLLKIYNIDKPLKEELLAIDEINELRLVDNNGKTDIYVSFKPETNFYQVYKEIEDISSKQLGNKRGKIIIMNEPSRELEELYYKMHYAIYEGLTTNEFVKMEKNVSKIVKNYQLSDYKLWVDNQAVYLQLVNKEDSLYRRIPKNQVVSIRVEGDDVNG
ncbi:MAG: hypothetical protein PWR10_1308 [Halanaerobiales bacterium]|nr:hypothetical protein [Halanaerobiales bacterium]